MTIKLTLLILTTMFLLGLDKSQTPGPHGGVIKSADKYYIEMKNIPDTTFLSYLLDKKMNTMSNKSISGEVKLYFQDSTVVNMDLIPIEGDAFTAKILPGFYSCKITFDISGKEVSAKFDMRTQLVNTK